MSTIPLLDIKDLTVEFQTRRGVVKAVQHIDIAVAKGETVGIVGESGSGKSVTSFAVMRILDRAGRIAEGSVTFSGIDVRNASEGEMRNLRGREMSMVFQNPRAALNPIRKVGHQIEDVLRQHVQAGSDDIKAKAIDILDQVRIARPQERYHAYPFEMSGGMCQRVVIALALACRPQLLIADEPTTGLDVTTQKTVMELIVELTRQRSMSTILITHDLGLAAAYCDRVVVMEKGRVVETAPSSRIFSAPQHAYTRKLMQATPKPGSTLRGLLPEGTGEPAAAPAGENDDGMAWITPSRGTTDGGSPFGPRSDHPRGMPAPGHRITPGGVSQCALRQRPRGPGKKNRHACMPVSSRQGDRSHEALPVEERLRGVRGADGSTGAGPHHHRPGVRIPPGRRAGAAASPADRARAGAQGGCGHQRYGAQFIGY